MYLNIASVSFNKTSEENRIQAANIRDDVGKIMTPSQKAEAQRLARERMFTH